MLDTKTYVVTLKEGGLGGGGGGGGAAYRAKTYCFYCPLIGIGVAFLS